MSAIPIRSIPGFYFDPVKKKYFPLTAQVKQEQERKLVTELSDEAITDFNDTRLKNYQEQLLQMCDIENHTGPSSNGITVSYDKLNYQNLAYINKQIERKFWNKQYVNKRNDDRIIRPDYRCDNNIQSLSTDMVHLSYLNGIVIEHSDYKLKTFSINSNFTFYSHESSCKLDPTKFNMETEDEPDIRKPKYEQKNYDLMNFAEYANVETQLDPLRRENIIATRMKDKFFVHVCLTAPNEPEQWYYHNLFILFNEGLEKIMPIKTVLPRNKQINCSTFIDFQLFYAIDDTIYIHFWVFDCFLFLSPDMAEKTLNPRKKLKQNSKKSNITALEVTRYTCPVDNTETKLLFVGYQNGEIFVVREDDLFTNKGNYLSDLKLEEFFMRIPFYQYQLQLADSIKLKKIISLQFSNANGGLLISGISDDTNNNSGQCLIFIANPLEKDFSKLKIVRLITKYQNLTKDTEICEINNNCVIYGKKKTTTESKLINNGFDIFMVNAVDNKLAFNFLKSASIKTTYPFSNMDELFNVNFSNEDKELLNVNFTKDFYFVKRKEATHDFHYSHLSELEAHELKEHKNYVSKKYRITMTYRGTKDDQWKAPYISSVYVL